MFRQLVGKILSLGSIRECIHEVGVNRSYHCLSGSSSKGIARPGSHCGGGGGGGAAANFPYLESTALKPSIPQLQSARTIIKYDLETGERHSHPGIYKRFTRLHWGVWIRPQQFQHKKLWARRNKFQAKQFMFLSKEHCETFDKMVTTYYRTRRYYPDDPLRPYHQRENFGPTRRKPGPARIAASPARVTKQQLEASWYEAHQLPRETPFKRHPYTKIIRRSKLE
ncbi:hypothetical protein FHG87_004236 [Trinorchestia longiramus]|nr:hypothetical protein FHG87_004236 [Trinorchestia longiramus]